MILEKLVATNLLTINTISDHSIESAIISLIVVLISLCLFIFWYKKKALLNFQAWALLIAIINAIFFFHYSPYSFHICPQEGVEYQFTSFAKVFLRFLEFLTSAITIWRVWQSSERYLPVGRKKLEKDHPFQKPKTRIMARYLAPIHTIKNGGNQVEKDYIIKKIIENQVLNKIK
jgi:uncharacterized membrane protein